jgi:hypothetical protein
MRPWSPACTVPLPRPRRGAYKARVLPVAWALAGMLALAPAAGPSVPAGEASADGEAATSAAASPEVEGSGRLVLGPDQRGTLTVVDAGGSEVATVVLRPGRRTLVELPPGRYTLRDANGRALESLALSANEVRAVELPPEFAAVPSGPARSSAARGPTERMPAVTTGRLGPPSLDAAAE